MVKDMTAAAKFLEKIQRNQPKSTRCRLKNVPVDVTPLDGNAFRITLDMSLPHAKSAAFRLNDIAADIRPWPAVGITQTEVTWDSMLNYLVMTGDLE